MRIDDTKSIKSAGSLKRKKNADTSSVADFQAFLGPKEKAEEIPSEMSSTTAMTGISSFLVQELAEKEDKTKEAVNYGEQMLQELEKLRHGLVAGNLEMDTVSRLLSSIKQNKPGFIDPKIQSVIDDIELRVAVEAAKLEKLKS